MRSSDWSSDVCSSDLEEYGHLDVLVINAGIVRDAAIWNMSEVDFDAVIRVHLKGAWSPSHHAAKHWRDRGRAGESRSDKRRGGQACVCECISRWSPDQKKEKKDKQELERINPK